jgi:SOS-response transcriptional repressor LexA
MANLTNEPGTDSDTMKKIDGWQNRLKERLKALGMTQEALANKIGVTRSAITHYLAGRRVPSLSQFSKLAEVLEANPSWLQFGSPDETPAEKISRLMASLHPVPIISWEEAAEFNSITKLNFSKIKEWVPNYFTHKANVYGLKIKGDAMISPNGQNKSFHPGDIIVVNHNGYAEPGDFVVAKLTTTDEVTFKQYVVDAGKKYLKPLNPQYPTIEITDIYRRLALVTHSICPNKLDDTTVTISYSGAF